MREEVCRPGGVRALGGGDASGICTGREGPTQGWGGGARARAERTWNMPSMFVTLDVSKLSGWLNFCAACRVEQGGRAMRGEVRVEGGRVRGAAAAHASGMHAAADLTRLQGGLGALLRAHARRAHREHANHARDAGRVEVQRLVERPRPLPSRKEDSELSGAGGCLGRRQRTRCARGGPDCSEQGLHAGGERTQNMPSMVVTLDVSKFTGWLN